MHRVTTTALTTVPLLGALLLGATPASAEEPRPGCGFGDDNHAHQAAPGKDPRGFRPGEGSGDTNNEHKGAPGQAGDASAPEDGPFGCPDDPRA